MSFTFLSLPAALLRAVNEQGYLAPTAVQAEAIPAAMQGRDVWARADTGSGKTAAFALPLIQRIATSDREAPRRLHTLVLVPTRELAEQVRESFRIFARYLPEPMKILSAAGGVSINPQMMALRGGADVLVATPGRLLDLVDHNAVQLSNVAALVLDEADRLLDLGFADEWQRIEAMLPKRRQNLLFSATFPQAVAGLAAALLRDPVRIDVESTAATQPDILQRAIEVNTARRTQLLRHLIQENGWTRVLVFVATKYSSEHVAEKLRRLSINAVAFHGELSQGARTQALADFKASKVRVVVATDVAARGIDIERLPVVVNYDLPRSADDYVHRIGRTGRAGESGIAVSFVTAEADAHFRLIEKRHGMRLERERIAGFEPTEVAVPAAPSTGGVKGKRKSKKDKLREARAPSASVEPARESGASIWARRQKPMK